MLAESLNLAEQSEILTLIMMLPVLREGRFEDGLTEAKRLGHEMMAEYSEVLKLLSFVRVSWLPNKEKVMFDDEDKNLYKILRIWDSKLSVTFESNASRNQWSYFSM